MYKDEDFFQVFGHISVFFATLVTVVTLAIPAFAKDPIRTLEGIVTKVSDDDTI